MKCVGLISGTSADGVDAALVEIEESLPPKLLYFNTLPIPDPVRNQIFDCFGAGGTRKICELNFRLGELFAEAVMAVIHKAGIKPEEVDLIGSHGQTIHHLPPDSAPTGSTLQIGEPSVIARRTGITTVADFRVADMAAGGQGAPLLPLLHHRLFSRSGKNTAVINIGGIANVTFLPANMKEDEVTAFDTGPGNMIIDALSQKFFHRPYDENGGFAAEGKVNSGLLDDLMGHPFLSKRPPKSTGREQFGVSFAEKTAREAIEQKISPKEILRTVTEFTARSIAGSCRSFLPAGLDMVWICGGGTRNDLLMKLIKDEFAPTTVESTEKSGVDPDAVEAMGFAFLSYRTIKGLPGNLPSVTGAEEAVILGNITQGKDFFRLV